MLNCCEKKAQERLNQKNMKERQELLPDDPKAASEVNVSDTRELWKYLKKTAGWNPCKWCELLQKLDINICSVTAILLIAAVILVVASIIGILLWLNLDGFKNSTSNGVYSLWDNNTLLSTKSPITETTTTSLNQETSESEVNSQTEIGALDSEPSTTSKLKRCPSLWINPPADFVKCAEIMAGPEWKISKFCSEQCEYEIATINSLLNVQALTRTKNADVLIVEIGEKDYDNTSLTKTIRRMPKTYSSVRDLHLKFQVPGPTDCSVPFQILSSKKYIFEEMDLVSLARFHFGVSNTKFAKEFLQTINPRRLHISNTSLCVDCHLFAGNNTLPRLVEADIEILTTKEQIVKQGIDLGKAAPNLKILTLAWKIPIDSINDLSKAFSGVTEANLTLKLDPNGSSQVFSFSFLRNFKRIETLTIILTDPRGKNFSGSPIEISFAEINWGPSSLTRLVVEVEHGSNLILLDPNNGKCFFPLDSDGTKLICGFS